MKGSNGVLSEGRAQTYLGKMSAYRKANETVLRGTNPTTVTNTQSAGIAWGAQITLGSLPSIAVNDSRVTDIKSLGANLFSEKFLKPTTALSRKALRAFDISTLATKGAQGTVAAPILGIEYQDVAMFANEEAPEIDLSVSKDVKIVLADVAKFDIQDIEVSVKGKQCTGVSVKENVVSATMPDALDGDFMKSINLTDGLNTASFRFQA